MKCGSKIASCAGQAMLGEMCLKNGYVGPARPCSFAFWEVFWLRSDENSKSCKTFFLEVLDATKRGWRKCVPKMGPLKRPGHAVPLQEQFGCQAVVLLFCPPKLWFLQRLCSRNCVFLFVKLPKPHQNIAKPCFCAFCTC